MRTQEETDCYAKERAQQMVEHLRKYEIPRGDDAMASYISASLNAFASWASSYAAKPEKSVSDG